VDFTERIERIRRRRPMSVRRLCDLKVNRTVAAGAPGNNDFTFNDILDKA
jgi:hypothetical protein